MGAEKAMASESLLRWRASLHPDHQEAIHFCSKPQDSTNSPSSLLRAVNGTTKTTEYVANRVLRPSCSVWTLANQATETRSAQWSRGEEKKTLKQSKISRNVTSEVIGLWPRVEFLRGCKVRDLPLQCQKASTERIAVQGRIETDT